MLKRQLAYRRPLSAAPVVSDPVVEHPNSSSQRPSLPDQLIAPSHQKLSALTRLTVGPQHAREAAQVRDAQSRIPQAHHHADPRHVVVAVAPVVGRVAIDRAHQALALVVPQRVLGQPGSNLCPTFDQQPVEVGGVLTHGVDAVARTERLLGFVERDVERCADP